MVLPIIRVKQEEPEEELEDDFHFEMKLDAEQQIINVNKLQLLESKFASLSTFPVGCKIGII